MQSYQTTLDGMRSEAFYGIITGDQPLEAFDDFVANWKASGGEEITQEVNEWRQNQ
jgi:putative aldouronate transport system substrate-binding protein